MSDYMYVLALMAKRSISAPSLEQEMLPWRTTKQSSSITNHAQSLTFQMECHLRINPRMTRTATGCKRILRCDGGSGVATRDKST